MSEKKEANMTGSSNAGEDVRGPQAIARASWSSKLAFVLAAAGSAVGLGTIWRFPYLAAHYGGGTFLIVFAAFMLLFAACAAITFIVVALGVNGGIEKARKRTSS